MNKYLSKALLYDKRVDILSITGCSFGIYAINFIAFFSSFFNKGHYNYSALMNLGIFLPSIFVISLAVSLYSNKDVKYSHLLTEPYKRDTLAITNLLIPILSSTFSLMLYGIIVTFIFALKGNSLNTVGILWGRIIFIITFLLLINSLFQFFQMLFGNYIAGTLIPFFFAIVVPISTLFFGNIISDKIPFMKISVHSIINLFGKIFIKLLESIGFVNEISNTGSFIYSSSSLTKIDSIMPISFSIVSGILIFLTIRFNRNLKVENTSKIFMFKLLEKIFLIISSLLVLTFVILVITIILPSLDLNNQNVLLIIDLCLIPLAIVIYKIICKIWSMASR